MQDLKYIELETGANPTAAVIWLHGLGASGHDFEPVVPELGLPDDAAVRLPLPSMTRETSTTWVQCGHSVVRMAWPFVVLKSSTTPLLFRCTSIICARSAAMGTHK